MLDVRKLIMLRAVAAEGSIAAAGRRLGYTRSAVSQQLTILEGEAGTPLLDRTGNKIMLTSAGRVLVEHAERILIELRVAEATLKSDDEPAMTGLLRVGVPFGEGPPGWGRALSEVRERFPGMEIKLAATTDEAGADEVRRDELDMAIVSRYGVAEPQTAAGLRSWVLGHDVLQLCAPLGHRLAGRRSCEMSDLKDEAWIVSPGTRLGQLTMSLCAIAGFEPRVVATVNDVSTATGLVGFGWGITIAPQLTPAARGAEFIRIPLEGTEIVRHTVVIVRDGDHLSPRIAATIEAMLALSAEIGEGI